MGESVFDVIIVGAGPAGLSAALILGRCRRRVIICDAGHPRNAVTRSLHGFLTRDGIEPAEFLRLAREQLRPYDTVELKETEVTKARRLRDRFEITLSNGDCLSSRKLLLATGVVDDVPEVEGLAAFLGRSVFHCPYCDAGKCEISHSRFTDAERMARVWRWNSLCGAEIWCYALMGRRNYPSSCSSD